jgi:ribonuclease HI
MNPDRNVEIYTDGACLGNPGPGGYGVVLLFGEHRRELSGGFRLTTNNRMELLAVIKGLEALKEVCQVTLYSDSKYVVDAVTQGWARRWQANGWMRNKRERAINPDLWETLLPLCQQHRVDFRWVKGHAGVPENERCDRLAVAAAQQPDLPADHGYTAEGQVGSRPI